MNSLTDNPQPAVSTDPPSSRSQEGGDRLISFEDARFTYEPFPMGVVSPVFAHEVYEALVEDFPPLEDFVFKPHLGNKYSLSEVNNASLFHRRVKSHELWRRLFAEVKSPDFASSVLDMLRDNDIDVGVQQPGRGRIKHGRHFLGRARRREIGAGEFARSIAHRPRKIGLNTRFEFSMLPADGGNIKPHTDAPQKFVTLIFSMVKPREWDSRYGGGTDMLRPHDARKSFNWRNDQLEFDEVEVLETFPFQPNQCVIFVKTFNSLHSVPPMTGPPGVLRRTLTINIERAGVV